jgi:hypothetical protein
MSETIRMSLQTVFGIAMTLFGRYSPRLASAINVGIVLTSPDVWPSVWGVYQSKQNTPAAMAVRNSLNNHDPFAYLDEHGQVSQQWTDQKNRVRDEAARNNPTQTKIEPGNAPVQTDRLPEVSTADYGELPELAGEQEEPAKAIPEHGNPTRKGKRGRPDGE